MVAQPRPADWLNQAFSTFTEASKRLERSYRELQEQVRRLTRELEEKNAALRATLQEKEEMARYLGQLLESLQTGVIATDPQGRITTMNPAAVRLTGIRLEPGETRFVDDVLGGGVWQGGSRSRSCEIRLGTSGETVVQVTASLIRDEHGTPTGAVFLLQDVTLLRRLEEQAARNSRLQAMGEMVAQIAHEIRNPLGSIELYASLLRKELRDPASRRLAERISAGVGNLNRVLTDMLLFTRSRKPAKMPVALEDLLEEAVAFCRHLMDHQKVSVLRHLPQEAAHVCGDPELLRQVVLNLVLNAVQAMPQGGALTLRVRLRQGQGIPEQELSSRLQRTIRFFKPQENPHGWAELEIEDTGVGIPEEHLGRIFDPFFSTRERGTGLGLAIVHTIVEAHGGALQVESTPGRGSVFRVLLPLWPRSPEAASPACGGAANVFAADTFRAQGGPS